MKSIKGFVKDETAAVTVDWVVLTAAVVGIAIAVAATIETSLNSSATTVSNNLGTAVASLTGGGSGLTFSGSSYADYLAAAGGDPFAADQAINADATSGTFFAGNYDSESGYPVYEGGSNGSGDPVYIIGGNEVNVADYSGTLVYDGL